jgi:hypothetical protein
MVTHHSSLLLSAFHFLQKQPEQFQQISETYYEKKEHGGSQTIRSTVVFFFHFIGLKESYSLEREMLALVLSVWR